MFVGSKLHYVLTQHSEFTVTGKRLEVDDFCYREYPEEECHPLVEAYSRGGQELEYHG